MTDAPERIWACMDGPMVGLFVSGGNTGGWPEYIRADLISAMTEQARQAGFAAGIEAAAKFVEGHDYYNQGDVRGMQPSYRPGEDMHHATIAKAIRALTPGATVTLTRERMDAIVAALQDLPEPIVSVALVNRLRAAMKGAGT